MIDILRTNNFNTSQVSSYDKTITNKRAKHTERRILKGFNISTVDTLQAAFAEKENNSSKDFFKVKSKRNSPIYHECQKKVFSVSKGGLPWEQPFQDDPHNLMGTWFATQI